MTKLEIPGGTIHKLPADLKKALAANTNGLAVWNDITPLARNEWICWTISVKQESTRINHVGRAVKELADGKRRPCCWIGCIHRPDKPISKSVQWALDKQKKSKK